MDTRMRIFTLLIIVVLLVGTLSALGGPNANQQQTVTPTIASSGVPTIVFPTVPPGGTNITSDHTYFHPTGVMSLPHLVGWDLSAGSEETVSPNESTKFSRIGATFINSLAYSVVHIFAEQDPSNKAKTLADLDGYYTKDQLNGAWQNFTGGWKELNRQTQGDSFVINFELYLDTNVYLGRQISRFNGDWLMVMRLVVPNNNAALLDALQNAEMPQYKMWTQALTAPLSWTAIADYAAGYVIRYPPDWRKVDGSNGTPFTITGTLGANSITLSTRTVPNKAIKSEDEAKAFVQSTWSGAGVQTVKAANVNETTGFAVSYTSPDADGNKRGAVATLLNGSNGTLYVANIQSSGSGMDLLDASNTNIPPELAQIRNSFFLIPQGELVPTATPLASPTPLPTAIVNTQVPTATTVATQASTEVSTAAPTIVSTEVATQSQ